MGILSRKFWYAVLTKLVELSISVKMWVLIWVSFLVYKIHGIGYLLNDFILNNIYSLEADKIAILAGLEQGIFDISTAMLTGVIVVIVISRQAFKHKKIDESDECKRDRYKSDESKINEIKNDME